jgi:hypothetical protein
MKWLVAENQQRGKPLVSVFGSAEPLQLTRAWLDPSGAMLDRRGRHDRDLGHSYEPGQGNRYHDR